MKICSRCKHKKPKADFHKRARSPDGLQPLCKACNGKQMKRYYRSNKQKYLEKNERYRDERMRFVLSYLASHPCVDCGEKDPIVLDFDHVRDKKSFNISVMVNANSLASLKEEIKKCEVRCSNCHRRKTAKGFGFRRLRLSETPAVYLR